jgi:hypothetical protein
MPRKTVGLLWAAGLALIAPLTGIAISMISRAPGQFAAAREVENLAPPDRAAPELAQMVRAAGWEFMLHGTLLLLVAIAVLLWLVWRTGRTTAGLGRHDSSPAP